jgi:hypothetical protein
LLIHVVLADLVRLKPDATDRHVLGTIAPEMEEVGAFCATRSGGVNLNRFPVGAGAARPGC